MLLKKLKVSVLCTAIKAELSNLIFPLLLIRFTFIILPFLLIVILKSHISPSWILIGFRHADCKLWIIKELNKSTWLCSDSWDIRLSSLNRSSKLVDGIRESNEIDFSVTISWEIWVLSFESSILISVSYTHLTLPTT